MSLRLVRSSLAAFGAAVLLTLGTPASAVFYSSTFDPASFLGTALFQFDDSCLLTDGLKSAASCNLQLMSVSVSVTDTVSGDTGTLDFAPVLPNSANMIDLIIAGGTLTGVDTGLVGWVFAGPCTGTVCGIPWWIQWTTNNQEEDPVNLFSGTCIEPPTFSSASASFASICHPNADPAGIATNVTFERVLPEPATLGLIGCALAAGWWSRRRTKRA